VTFRRSADPHAVEVGGKRPSVERVPIATGSRPAVPDITGLDRVPYFTGDLPTVDVAVGPTGLPRSLLIVGCGYDAPESARMSPRIGTGVTVLERDPPWLAATESGSHGGR